MHYHREIETDCIRNLYFMNYDINSNSEVPFVCYYRTSLDEKERYKKIVLYSDTGFIFGRGEEEFMYKNKNVKKIDFIKKYASRTDNLSFMKYLEDYIDNIKNNSYLMSYRITDENGNARHRLNLDTK